MGQIFTDRPLFLSTLSLRRATLQWLLYIAEWSFLSTLSLRRATLPVSNRKPVQRHFYPRSPCGERPSYSQHVTRPSGYFYPRSPCGERPSRPTLGKAARPISIHALLAESDLDHGIALVPHQQISIHALLAESDITDIDFRIIAKISIHALLAESDG